MIAPAASETTVRLVKEIPDRVVSIQMRLGRRSSKQTTDESMAIGKTSRSN